MRFASALPLLLAGCGVAFQSGDPGSSGAGGEDAAGGAGASGLAPPVGGGGSEPTDELCNNGRDDDDDALIDCDDPDCETACSADAFVDDDAPPGGDGSLRAPFDDLPPAMSVCDGSPKVIYVFGGTYSPFTLPPSCRVVGESQSSVVVDGAGQRTVDVPEGGDPPAALEHLTLTGGAAPNGAGGCLRLAGGDLSMLAVAVSTCSANEGGGIAVQGGLLTGEKVRVSGAMANAGAGIVVSGGALDASDWWVQGNIAMAEGGGVWVNSNGSATFSLSTLGPGNEAVNGGAIYQEASSSTVTLVRSKLTGNYASDRGGGMYHADGPLEIENVYVVDNEAGTRSGGIHQAGGDTLFTHVTIAGNAANEYPGGIDCAGGSGEHRNILIWGNPGGGSQGCPLSTSSIQENPCCSNTSVDPEFVDPSNGDYHLGAQSPVIDYGDQSTSSPVDFDGEPRDALPDPGADEAM